MKVVGYTLDGQDNDSYMFRDNSLLSRCEGCGYRLELSPTNPNYVLKNCSEDISATYDGQTIASKAFKDFCERNEYRGINFGVFDNDPRHFHFIVMPEVKFDAIRRKTRLENLCPQCGNYESVVGAKPAYLLITEPLDDGFYRSDLLFASGNGKHPINLVGIETKAKLEVTDLKGLEFAPAYGIE